MKKHFSFVCVALVVLGCLSSGAKADLGPKPTVDIDLVYNLQKIADASFGAKMLGCYDQQLAQDETEQGQDSIAQLRISSFDAGANCYWQPAPLAWGGSCSESHCRFSYFPPSEFKLAVYIPSLDKTFVTNKITRENFASRYRVELSADGTATINETTSIWASIRIPDFVGAFLLTIFFEMLVTWIFVTAKKLPRKKILVYVLGANVLSLPAVWFLFPLIDLPEFTVIAIFELFAVLFETYFIYYFCKQILSFKRTLLLSALNNFVSLFAGGYAFVALMFF
jgi:hypothetical protein